MSQCECNAIIETASLQQWLLNRTALLLSQVLQEDRDVCDTERHRHTKKPKLPFQSTPTNPLHQTAHAGVNEASSSKAICRITCWCWKTTSKEFKCYGILLDFLNKPLFKLKRKGGSVCFLNKARNISLLNYPECLF